jgi:hypothetical protein
LILWLAAFDVVLCFKVAAREIVRAGERNEGDLLFLPQRVDRIAQDRIQPQLESNAIALLDELSGFAIAIVGRDS